jgi:tRNA(Ile)-lysidine synthase
VAVSGGADSVALLRLLLELREKLGIVLSVVHFNHMLRGRASDADEKFVGQLAEGFGLSLHAARADVTAQARRVKANLEDAARKARYSFFRKLVEQGTLDLVATAHTMDDQAETVVSHILRGTGLAGLSGIYPVAEFVVRPLLFARRSELRAFLRAKKQPWREDATNRDTSRMRARIRRKLLPLLEKHFQPGVVAHLAALADHSREDEALLDGLAERESAAIAKHQAEGIRIRIDDLLGVPAGTPSKFKKSKTVDLPNTVADVTRFRLLSAQRAIGKRILRTIARQVRFRPGQWNALHLNGLWELALHGQNGKVLQLPGGIVARRDRDSLLFCALEKGDSHGAQLPTKDYEFAVDLGSLDVLQRVPQLGCAFRFRVIDWPAHRRDTTFDTSAALDCGRLIEPLALRNWRPGDRLRPAGHGKGQKLKRLLNEKRIGRWERPGWPVLTSGGIVAWARGFPAAAEFAADAKTRKAVVITEEGS